MNLLQKLIQFFINLTNSKLNAPSLNKISQSVSPNTQIKQVEHSHQQKTITSFTEQILEPVTEILEPTIIMVGSECIPKLEPGYVFESCPLMDCEDYPEILERGLRDMMNKLPSRPIYVLSSSATEFYGKKRPKNYNEKMLQQTGNYVHNTGRPRNFNNILVKIPISVTAPVYLVEIENSLQIQQLAKKLLPALEKFGLHGKFDDIFLAFTKFTKSKIVTSDRRLILSHTQAQCENPINFQEYLEKIMQPSPITVVLRERRNYYKNHNNPRWKKR